MIKYYKILVADDDKHTHIILKTILNDKLFEIFNAYDGSEAVDITFKNRIDLILMDQRMPNMDGLTAAKTIRKMCPKLPIISISAYDPEPDHLKVFDEFISKPIDKKLLRNTVKKLLNIQ